MVQLTQTAGQHPATVPSQNFDQTKAAQPHPQALHNYLPNLPSGMDYLTFVANVPPEMLQAKRWLVRALDKQPYYPSGGPRRGPLDGADDVRLLGTLEDAWKAVLSSSGRFSGVGFALGPDEHGLFWQGIDLDKISQNQLDALAHSAPSYVELSPSRLGIHAIGYGRHFATLGGNGTGVEAYASARYFTVTGEKIGSGELGCLAEYVEQQVAPIHHAGRTRVTQSPEQVPVNTSTAVDLRSALNSLRSDDYEFWIRIGLALRGLGEVGRGLWLDWSMTSKKYRPTDASVWDTLDPKRISHETVFWEAQQQGWVNPSSNAARLPVEGQSQPPQEEAPWLVSIHDIYSNPAPEPEFLTEQLMPAGEVTLLAAHGGMGKSSLMLMWAVHAALGIPFLGKQIVQAPVIFFSGEDRANTVRYRLRRICIAMQCDPRQVGTLLTVVDATQDPVLFAERQDRERGKYTTTSPIYDRLKRLGEKLGARYFFIDNASDAFDADEVRRAHVRAFLSALRALGTERGAGIMLASHIDKQSAKGGGAGQEYSGSTAWNNSVRSRLFLGPPLKAEEDDPSFELRHSKSNHGRLALPIPLGWSSEGLLEMTSQVQVAQEREAVNSAYLTELLHVIHALQQSNVNIPTATTGGKTTFHVLSAHPLFPKGLNAKRTNLLISRAQVEEKIQMEEYTTLQRKPATRWVVCRG